MALIECSRPNQWRKNPVNVELGAITCFLGRFAEASHSVHFEETTSVPLTMAELFHRGKCIPNLATLQLPRFVQSVSSEISTTDTVLYY